MAEPGLPPSALESRARAQLQASPRDADARLDLANALRWQRRWSEAATEYESLLAQSPGHTDGLFGLAQVRRGQGDPQAALPLLAQVRALAPDYQDAWRASLHTLHDVGTPAARAQARLLSEEARARFPSADWALAERSASADQAAAAPAGAPAATAPTSSLEVELAAGHQRLTRGLAAWNDQSALLAWRGSGHRAAWGGLKRQERYGLRDEELHVGGAYPLADRVQGQLEWQHSPTARVSARDALGVELHVQPVQGWSLGFGARAARYRGSRARTLSVSIDHYTGPWRWGYMLYLGGPTGASLKAAHRLQTTYHYGDRSWVGLSLNAGVEQEAAPGGPLQTRVRGAGLSGWHELNRHWIAVWGLDWQRYDQRYTRRGLRLGLRHAF